MPVFIDILIYSYHVGAQTVQIHEQTSVRYDVYGVASPLRALQRQRQKQKYQSRLEQSILGWQDTPWASAWGSLSFSLSVLRALKLSFFHFSCMFYLLLYFSLLHSLLIKSHYAFSPCFIYVFILFLRQVKCCFNLRNLYAGEIEKRDYSLSDEDADNAKLCS